MATDEVLNKLLQAYDDAERHAEAMRAQVLEYLENNPDAVGESERFWARMGRKGGSVAYELAALNHPLYHEGMRKEYTEVKVTVRWRDLVTKALGMDKKQLEPYTSLGELVPKINRKRGV